MSDIEDLYELSPMQQGMLFHSLAAPDPGVYLITFSYALRGRLDVDALERAWQRVVDRNPILRTSFHWGEIQKPLQAEDLERGRRAVTGAIQRISVLIALNCSKCCDRFRVRARRSIIVKLRAWISSPWRNRPRSSASASAVG